MCDPLSMGLASGGLSLASSAAGFFGQSSRAKAQAQANQTSTLSAILDYNTSMQQLALRMQQERIQAATKTYYLNKEKNAAVGEAKARASEMGVTGNTLDNLVGDLEMQNAERTNIVRENSDATVQQLGIQGQGLTSSLFGSISSLPRASSPGFGSLALGAASAGLDGFNTYSRLLKIGQ